jgi:N-acetylglucosamine malate deacetylase 1
VAKKILALSPHPDDESIGCGGFLLAHAGKAEIHIVNVYNGAETCDRRCLQHGRNLIELACAQVYKPAPVCWIISPRSLLKRAAAIVSDCDGAPGATEVAALRRILQTFAPKVVLLPWMLDNHSHHKHTNRLFADAAQGLDLLVLGYEIWSLLSPNAYFDISDVQDRKRDLIALHVSQLRTVDYITYSGALARVRAFHNPVRENRTGAVEAFVALPSCDYCDLVRHAIKDPL